ncbi:DUF397 domain-containing protein [Nocardia terpenica]|uniref:DUF397 domain-containing protein n=1 Tax=Nocardia terpenica TaxID=455432 RepID=UPI0018932924|nr:DUF397 domain-containing protein [Nocardia terpenica]MBF6065829.1 DUF397 domain-containing protein [Nocardia terpenica]MBF6108408.1 DUF397 domain-containing protein [Nocardia terpenica]MBF6115944.1 DUF397 domain-containing protein [Nocardia terpenica]MBF6123074.1 DUF397 domain-containing protein [Nocardia terpenica]MBF6156252.1 DUF397 domain-containing protein [Nocardia terpenica]
MNISNIRWFKSTYSKESLECVEVAFLSPNAIGVRDSKDPTGPALTFTAAEWDSFTATLRTDLS